MFQLIVLAACVAFAAAGVLPQTHNHNHKDVVLVKETLHDNIGVEGYNFGYELSDGQSRQETAELKTGGTEGAYLVVRGSYTIVDPATGKVYTVNYVADETGYHADGDIIPK